MIDLTKKIGVQAMPFGVFQISPPSLLMQSENDREAYRRLFQAAPQMLLRIKQTAELLRKDYLDDINGDPFISYAVRDLDAIIAEAEGATP